MGNACAACSEEKPTKILSFRVKETSSQSEVNGNLEEHIDRKVDKVNEDYSEESEQDIEHKPLPDIATDATNLNEFSEKVKETITTLKEFKLTLEDDPATINHPIFGPYLYENGDSYKGQFFKGLREGYGELVTKDGEAYFGTWKEDKMDGKGRYIFKSGCYYEGELVNGKFEGKGTFKDLEVGSTYVGKFKDGYQHGSGKETYKDGSVYDGQFKESSKHGLGILKFPDGGKFSGDFKNDLIDGKGKDIILINFREI